MKTYHSDLLHAVVCVSILNLYFRRNLFKVCRFRIGQIHVFLIPMFKNEEISGEKNLTLCSGATIENGPFSYRERMSSCKTWTDSPCAYDCITPGKRGGTQANWTPMAMLQSLSSFLVCSQKTSCSL